MVLVANYATDSDLRDYHSGVFDYGKSSFDSELTKASTDILNRVKAEWWPQAVNQYYSRENQDVGGLTPSLDETYLNTEALKAVTVYWCFAKYVFPPMSKYTDEGDAFSRQAKFYDDLFRETWELTKKLPLYDFNKDLTFSDTERKKIRRKVARG